MRLLTALAAVLLTQPAYAQIETGATPALEGGSAQEEKTLVGDVGMPGLRPTPEHLWLKQLEGKWESEAKITLPGGGEMTNRGVSTNRMLGGFWLVSEAVADMGGQKMTAVQQIGYDPEKKQFVGTWVDGTNAHIWRYTGKLSDDRTTLILEASGPNFMTGQGTANFRDTYRIVSKDTMEAVSYVEKGGEWQEVMKAEVKRVD